MLTERVGYTTHIQSAIISIVPVLVTIREHLNDYRKLHASRHDVELASARQLNVNNIWERDGYDAYPFLVRFLETFIKGGDFHALSSMLEVAGLDCSSANDLILELEQLLTQLVVAAFPTISANEFSKLGIDFIESGDLMVSFKQDQLYNNRFAERFS